MTISPARLANASSVFWRTSINETRTDETIRKMLEADDIFTGRRTGPATHPESLQVPDAEPKLPDGVMYRPGTDTIDEAYLHGHGRIFTMNWTPAILRAIADHWDRKRQLEAAPEVTDEMAKAALESMRPYYCNIEGMKVAIARALAAQRSEAKGQA